MQLGDYIAVWALRNANMSARQSPPSYRVVISMNAVVSSIVAALSLSETGDIDMIVDHLYGALPALADMSAIEPYETPHALTRYILRYNEELFDADHTPLKGSVRQAAITYELLGLDWLTESMRFALSKQTDPRSDARPEQALPRWEPLPLDRPNAELDALAAKVDDLREMVRSDNGYASEEPVERDEVLTSLELGADYLRRTGRLHRPLVQSLLAEPLQKLWNRFGLAAIGVTAAELMKGLVGFIVFLLEHPK